MPNDLGMYQLVWIMGFVPGIAGGMVLMLVWPELLFWVRRRISR